MPRVVDAMNVMVADRGFDWRPRARHVLIAASLVAHSLAIAWIVLPGRVERVAHKPEYQVVDFAPRLPCADVVWIVHQHGCVITRQRVCRSTASIDDKEKHRER